MKRRIYGYTMDVVDDGNITASCFFSRFEVAYYYGTLNAKNHDNRVVKIHPRWKGDDE